MPAPKGHPPYPGCETGGRPPKWDADAEADKLNEWSLKDDSVNIMRFCFDKEYCYDTMMGFCDRSEKFSVAYKKAMQRCGARRQERLDRKEMNYGVWEKYIGIYDPAYHNYQEAQLDKETERKSKIAAAYSKGDLDHLESIKEQLETSRKESKKK